MTGMNNALLQLALMLRGNTGLGSGMGNDWSGPLNPNSWQNATPPMNPMVNSWAAGPHQGAQGGHLPTTPAQELLLGPMNPAWEIPFQPAWEFPEYFPIPEIRPHVGPLPPDVLPPLPPTAIPIPDENEDDDISKYNPPGKKKMSKRCAEEWEWARNKCDEEEREQYKRGDYDTIFDHEKCKAGYVSIECGGTPLDWGPKGKPYKPKPGPKPKPNNFIIA